MAALPITFALSNWYTLKFIAARLGKHLRTVQYWHERGLFTRMGLKVITVHSRCAPMSTRGITWVQIPNNSKYAMFKNLNLDIPNITKLASSCERSIQGS